MNLKTQPPAAPTDQTHLFGRSGQGQCVIGLYLNPSASALPPAPGGSIPSAVRWPRLLPAFLQDHTSVAAAWKESPLFSVCLSSVSYKDTCHWILGSTLIQGDLTSRYFNLINHMCKDPFTQCMGIRDQSWMCLLGGHKSCCHPPAGPL